MAALPYLFDYLALNYEKRKTFSSIQQATLQRYFAFNMVNIFATIGLGSIFTAIGQVFDAPGCLFLILGEAMPKVIEVVQVIWGW